MTDRRSPGFMAGIAPGGGACLDVAGLAEAHPGRIVPRVVAVAILALDRVHKMKAVVEVDEVGEFEDAGGRDLRIARDLRMAERALRDGGVADLVAKFHGGGVAVGALQLR